jgi:sugar/nucleoside kinase (ribokinase family)
LDHMSASIALSTIKHAGCVVLSDYNKGLLTPPFIGEIVEECKRRGVPCVADCNRYPGLYDGCITKSNHEWSTLWRRCDKGVVTRGCFPPLVDSFMACNNLPSVNCINHVGAGDCFAAHLALGLAYKFPLKEAATIAHSAGRVYVQHPHNRPPRPDEIVADMASMI